MSEVLIGTGAAIVIFLLVFLIYKFQHILRKYRLTTRMAIIGLIVATINPAALYIYKLLDVNPESLFIIILSIISVMIFVVPALPINIWLNYGKEIDINKKPIFSFGFSVFTVLLIGFVILYVGYTILSASGGI